MSERRTIFWAWFQLTSQERLFIAGIVAIALIGLIARYWHLAHQEPAPYQLPPVEQATYDAND